MPITINGSGTITGAATLATTVVSPTLTTATLTTPNINSAPFATVTGTAPIYPCRAWVNFDGTGTPAIRASGNVSSITDNGVGEYTVNFTTAMPDANYSVAATANGNAGSAIMVCTNSTAYNASAPTASACRIQVTSYTANNDCAYVSVAVFR